METPSVWKTQTFVALGLALAASFASSSSAHAGEAFKDLADIVPRIKNLLAQKNASSVSISQIEGPAAQKATGGPGIAKFLADGLTREKIKVEDTANIGISGKYRASDDPATKLKVVVLKLEVEDRDGNALDTIERTIRDPSAISILLGLSVSLPQGDETANPDVRAARDQALRVAISDPGSTTKVNDARVSAGDRNDLAIEIDVKQAGNFTPRPPSQSNGVAFVPLTKDEVFGIRLINDTDKRVAVSLHIDGLSIFSISENKAYTHVLIEPRSQVMIPGWHVSNKESRAFLVTGLDEGLAAKLKSRAPVGTVTACFHTTTEPAGAKGEDFSVGSGDTVNQQYQETSVVIGQALASVSVRYKKPVSGK